MLNQIATMKNPGLVLACMSAVFFCAAASASSPPNLYELMGRNLHISYSTSSLTGEARLHYRDSAKEKDLEFSGDEIRAVRSEIGTLVTVTISQVPDLKTVTATLLLPNINLHGDAAFFKALLIHTTHRTSIGGPELVKGVIQSHSKKWLKGKASRVDFIQSNLSGKVTLSPTCGGGIRPGQDCSQAFAGAWIQVLDNDKNIAATAITNAKGLFETNVNPGTYMVRAGILYEGPPPIPRPLPLPIDPSPYPRDLESGSNTADILVSPFYPHCPDTPVTVPEQGSAYIEIDCDTGIR